MNINLRPYYAEGSKTLAFEIAEQLGWELPDRCVVPVASGSLFTKIARGFQEWSELGLIEGELPRMNGAQAEGCSPVASAFAAGQDVCRPVKPNTIAKSLAIGNPADGPYALDLARRSGRLRWTPSATRRSARDHPAGPDDGRLHRDGRRCHDRGAREARRARRHRPDERVVLVITGDGLKTLDAVRGTFETYEIDPSVEAFEALCRPSARPWPV